MAVRCYRGLGDEARAVYLSRTLAVSENYEKEHDENGIIIKNFNLKIFTLWFYYICM